MAAGHGRRWVVAQHAATEGPGVAADSLAEAGARVEVVRLDLGQRLPPLDEVAGILSMGGAMGVHDDDVHPWLAEERRWLADAAGRALPVLGVCLGAQQLAAALGATVRKGPEPAVGLGSVTLTDEGRDDPVLGPEGDELPVVHWHGDTFELPDRARHLAIGTRYAHQAFRYGELVYGLQFHVEVDGALARAWAPDLPAGVVLDPGGLAAVEATGRRVFTRFVALAAGRDVTASLTASEGRRPPRR